jgi:hypothetical protein
MLSRKTSHRSTLVRCLLMFSLWQAPLPVWHSHGTLAADSSESCHWLARHLESHHAEVDPVDDVPLGWHVHFEMPDSDGEPSESPGPSARLPAPSTVTIERAQLLEVFPFAADVVTSPLPGIVTNPACVIGPPGRCLGFFTHYAASLALPLRLGVARC